MSDDEYEILEMEDINQMIIDDLKEQNVKMLKLLKRCQIYADKYWQDDLDKFLGELKENKNVNWLQQKLKKQKEKDGGSGLVK